MQIYYKKSLYKFYLINLELDRPTNKTLDEEKGNFEHEGNFKGRNVKKKSEEEPILCPLSSFEENQFSDQEHSSFPNYENEDFFLNHKDSFLQIDTDGIQQYFEANAGVKIEPGNSSFEV